MATGAEAVPGGEPSATSAAILVFPKIKLRLGLSFVVLIILSVLIYEIIIIYSIPENCHFLYLLFKVKKKFLKFKIFYVQDLYVEEFFSWNVKTIGVFLILF